MNLYYISFATDTEFLGATVVEGISETNALEIATNNGLNPGGQAVILEVPEDIYDAPDVVSMKYKLFNKEKMRAQGSKCHADLDENIQMALEYHSVAVDQ